MQNYENRLRKRLDELLNGIGTKLVIQEKQKLGINERAMTKEECMRLIEHLRDLFTGIVGEDIGMKVYKELKLELEIME